MRKEVDPHDKTSPHLSRHILICNENDQNQYACHQLVTEDKNQEEEGRWFAMWFAEEAGSEGGA